MGKFNFRKFVNQNSAVVTIAAVALLVLALGAIVLQMQGPSRNVGPVDLWFYDLNTGELFVAKSDALPPILSPTDNTSADLNPDRPAGVKAHVYACTNCQDENDRFVAYLEMYRPDVRERLVQLRDNPQAFENMSPEDNMFMMGAEDSLLVRSLDDDRWVAMMSEQGAGITMRVIQGRTCPDGNPPRWCAPGTK